MTDHTVALWEAPSSLAISDRISSVPQIVSAATQLRPRERKQISANFEAGHYELVGTFVWHRTMVLLKGQLSKLGNRFISELLQRPDIDDDTDLKSAISETEALALARDLGMITPTQAMRLAHAQETINHFASLEAGADLDSEEGMTHEEALLCLRVCVQGVLGHESISVAGDFAAFRTSLEAQTFTSESQDIIRLQQSPYLFIRTAVSVLLSVIREGKGAQLEHAARNALLIIRLLWPKLKQPERWQIGQAYSAEFNEGNKDSVKALHAILLSVKGFDYVPESLRSDTFSRVAAAVVAAHQGTNNYYNEPKPMRELADLGTSIPNPALAICVTAALCVKLGNPWGIAWNAQTAANEVLQNISQERWLYYLDGCLERDLVILPKLTSGAPQKRWIEFVPTLKLDPARLKSRKVRSLLSATNAGHVSKVTDLARQMLTSPS
jgi:hypothetical protein